MARERVVRFLERGRDKGDGMGMRNGWRFGGVIVMGTSRLLGGWGCGQLRFKVIYGGSKPQGLVCVVEYVVDLEVLH